MHCPVSGDYTNAMQAKEEVKKLIEKAQSNELEAQPGRTIMESFENQVRWITSAQHYPSRCTLHCNSDFVHQSSERISSVRLTRVQPKGRPSSRSFFLHLASDRDMLLAVPAGEPGAEQGA